MANLGVADVTLYPSKQQILDDLTESYARLVEATADRFKGKRFARMALAIAARAILRGRYLTADEQIDNLAAAIEEMERAS